MDDRRPIALVESTTIDASVPANALPRTTTRFQFTNHLGSACLELDEAGAVISYEEYYPYGSTSYQAGRTIAEVGLKRYRYTGKERDEETGFYYHGARYYAPWIGRWTSGDPAGLDDGPNLYAYARANPVGHTDPTGTTSVPKPEAGLLESTGSRLIGNYPGWNRLWNEAVNEVLGPQFGGKTAAENIKRFEAHIAEVRKLKGAGSNKQVGTAIFEARRAYSRVRTAFGKIAERAGISLKGIQVHHGIGKAGELAKLPEKALDAGALHLTSGNAGTPGTGHNKLHQLNESERIAKAEANAGKAVEKEVASDVAKAVKTDVKVGGEALKDAGAGAKQLLKTGGEDLAKQGLKTGGKELVQGAEKAGLKEGAKLLGTKASKFVPFVGIGVGIYLVKEDLKKNDLVSAAWDTVEAIPVVGDVVGAGHLGIIAGTAANEGLGIDKVAAEHGMAVEGVAKKLGLSQDAAMIAGATGAALSAITVAPTIAVNRMIAKYF